MLYSILLWNFSCHCCRSCLQLHCPSQVIQTWRHWVSQKSPFYVISFCWRSESNVHCVVQSSSFYSDDFGPIWVARCKTLLKNMFASGASIFLSFAPLPFSFAISEEELSRGFIHLREARSVWYTCSRVLSFQLALSVSLSTCYAFWLLCLLSCSLCWKSKSSRVLALYCYLK